jgi:hypothetical protein
MRNWDNVSDYELESIVGDLLGAELGVRFERFTPGRDQGIDLRHLRKGRGPDVVQCKHYKSSRWEDLLRAAKRETKRLAKMEPTPGSYRFVTSLGLSPKRKAELAAALAPFIAAADDVYGRDDLEALLDRHEDVERRQVKLWLGSGAQLAGLLRPGVAARSRVLAERVQRMLPLYVQGEAFAEGTARLGEHHVCLITGPPGIGKTTLAHMLVADAIGQGYEPIEVSYDVGEAWDDWDSSRKQIFLYDDFLGQTMLGELRKNEESRLLAFLRVARESPRTLMVLTTREYILQQAVQTYEAFRRAGLPRGHFVLGLSTYRPLERAQILHNHVWHSQALTPAAVEALGVDRGYRRLVEHPNFNPRVIEYITGLQEGNPVVRLDGEGWLEFAVAQLDHPEEIWRTAYEQHLGDTERTLLLALATMPPRPALDDLEEAFDALAGGLGTPRRPRRFTTAMERLDDSFIATRMEPGHVVIARALNPGLLDFLQAQLLGDADQVRAALRQARFFEQLMVIWELVTDGPTRARDAVLHSGAFAEGADRLFGAKSATWDRIGRTAYEVRLVRSPANPDGRLAQLLRLARDAPSAPRGLDTVLKRQMEALAARWDTGEVRPRSAVRIAEMLVAGEAPAPRDWPPRLKGALLAEPSDLDHWDAIFNLQRLLPGLITDDDVAELADTFASFAEDWLSLADESETLEDLEHLQTLAEDLDVPLDEELVDGVRQQIEQRLAAEDAQADADLEDYRIERAFGRDDGAGERAAMDAMFGVRE